MFNLVYKSVVVECSTGIEDLAKAIEKKSEEMLNKGYKLVTMSMVGTDKIIAITQQSRMRISFKQICRVRFETTGSKGTQTELGRYHMRDCVSMSINQHIKRNSLFYPS